jgi:ubiquinone/menaquinone biosynthesis C-methylase UbiE
MLKIILILISSSILLFTCCHRGERTSHGYRMGDLSFRTMAVIHDNPLRHLLDNPLRSLKAAEIQPGQQVLEVGCGTGYFTVLAAKLVGDEGCIQAIDLQPLAIERTEKKVKEAGLTNVQFKLADAAKTGLPEESMDLVFLFGVIHALPLDVVLPELHRVLKPDGVIAVRGFQGYTKSITSGGYFSFIGREKGVLRFKKE